MMNGKLTECLVPLLAKSGAIIPVETKVTKGRWRGRGVLIGISRDITRRKTAEEKLQRAHDELELKVDIRTAELSKANAELKAEIAEHTRTETNLRESEGNYRELFTAEPDAIIIADAENKRIIDANPSALQLYGYSYEEICGLSALALSAEPEKSLLHDVGKLFILSVVEKIRRSGNRVHQPSNALLDEVMRSMHSDYGYMLMNNWNLPNRYCAVARDHHKDKIDPKDTLLVLVRMAHHACHKVGVGSTADPAVILTAFPEAKSLDLSDMDLAQLEIQLEDLPLC